MPLGFFSRRARRKRNRQQAILLSSYVGRAEFRGDILEVYAVSARAKRHSENRTAPIRIASLCETASGQEPCQEWSIMSWISIPP